jgi:hypothetical protein
LRGSIVRLALEVRLFATELIAERSGGRRPGPASILPLRFGGQSKLLARRQITGYAAQVGQLVTERFRL